jgi:type I site-specific restriction endonuclease
VDFEGERESEREKSSEDAPHTPHDLTGASLHELKKSTMSMNSAYISKFNSSVRVQSLTALEIDNTRLKLQVAELQKENEKLQRTLLNYAPLKLKYDQALESLEVSGDLSKGLDGKKLEYLKERSGDLYRMEVESHYKRKTEQIAREWKDKLYEIVCKYEDEIELLKNDISALKHDRHIADKKICTLANEKCLLEMKLIELEK